MPTPISACRICGNHNLIKVLDLGDQALTGIFPAKIDQPITVGPLQLLKCHEEDGCCGLLQLGHSYDLAEMYGQNYGYRSGLNPSMVGHLKSKVHRILSMVNLEKGDLILDIGSNDGTTLSAYPNEGFRLVGIDPTAKKFSQYYPPHVSFIPDFFSSNIFSGHFPTSKAKVITSFSMFYDLENPMQFMREIFECLHDDGIWVFEQSYMPTMLKSNSYDTVCHEHLEYYALHQIKWMADRVGFKIVDVELNDINGGSFSVVVAKATSSLPVAPNVESILAEENDQKLNSLATYGAFSERILESKKVLRSFLDEAKKMGKKVYGLGASTKGNVLLQYCDVTNSEVSAVAEVNPDKYSCFTPGTLLPIRPQDEVLVDEAAYFLVLPWHFREFFLTNPKFKGRQLVFPLPELEVIVA